MMHIKILAVGNCKESYWRDAVKEYQKRLQTDCKLEIVELAEARFSDNPTPGELEKGRKEEAQRMERQIPLGSYRIALCIEGKELDSEAFSKKLAALPLEGKSSVCFLIGGSFGMTEEMKASCDLRLSFSSMTFPHQLARVMLLEQIYRAFQLMKGSRYHK